MVGTVDTSINPYSPTNNDHDTMTTNIINSRESVESESLRNIEVQIKKLEVEKNNLMKNRDVRLNFSKQVKDWGYESETFFLIQMGYLPDPKGKRRRTVIPDELRKNIIFDLQLRTMSSKEVSLKHGVPVSSVDNIKGDVGLTTPRKKKDVTTPSSPTSVPSVVPSTVSFVQPTEVVSVEEVV